PWADLAAAFIAPFPYDASVNADVEEPETQKPLTSQLNETIIGSLPEELVAHLKLGENAGWIYSTQPNPHYGTCVPAGVGSQARAAQAVVVPAVVKVVL
ncbi:Hypothetical protein, putative, partial [Bodo saltans]